MSFAVIIYGPTAVGKTTFANALAAQIGGEIINGDAAQLYTPFTIGTAKPDWRSASVAHHLFDICDEPHNYSVTIYRIEAEKKVAEIKGRGNIPIFVGGSGFYLQSLFFPVNGGDCTNTLQQGDDQSWSALYSVDPLRASAIHPHDTYRISRALSLYQLTQELPSALKPAYSPITQFFLVELSRSSESLKLRIQERIKQMLAIGWIEETDALIDTPWESFVKQKKWIGYSELIHYCRSGKKIAQLAEVEATVKSTTWRYARKQMTYGRMMARKIAAADTEVPYIKVDLTTGTHDEYVRCIANDILNLQKKA